MTELGKVYYLKWIYQELLILEMNTYNITTLGMYYVRDSMIVRVLLNHIW